MRDEKNASYVKKLRQYIDRLFDFAAKRGVMSHPPSPHFSTPEEFVVLRVAATTTKGALGVTPTLKERSEKF